MPSYLRLHFRSKSIALLAVVTSMAACTSPETSPQQPPPTQRWLVQVDIKAHPGRAELIARQLLTNQNQTFSRLRVLMPAQPNSSGFADVTVHLYFTSEPALPLVRWLPEHLLHSSSEQTMSLWQVLGDDAGAEESGTIARNFYYPLQHEYDLVLQLRLAASAARAEQQLPKGRILKRTWPAQAEGLPAFVWELDGHMDRLQAQQALMQSETFRSVVTKMRPLLRRFEAGVWHSRSHQVSP